MIRVYRNIKNFNKEIRVKHTKCGHYLWKQMIYFPNGICNPIGASIRSKNGCFRRTHKATIDEVLKDYVEVYQVTTINRKE